ncbi:MAG: glycoside hydrolase family 13 protein [Halanaerobiales bacterium]|nr:glycoside hydrolase family 13 protein [Halanaerobiales bacterium]
MQKVRILMLLLLVMFMMTGTSNAVELKAKHIFHNPESVRFAYLTESEEVNLKIQVQRDGVDAIQLIFDDGLEIPMEFYTVNSFYSFYKTQFRPREEASTYFFKIFAGNEVVYLGQNAVTSEKDQIQPYNISMASMQTFAIPNWAKGAVIYQLFPDRFYNGDLTNDPKFGEYDVYGSPVESRSWDQLPSNPARGADFFGGDLQGVLDQLDYLQDLGIQAIYFNPIHESVSNHKYDASDYMKVDPHFGTNELFKNLVDEAKKRGIYIIIDGVFNHTGSGFWAFQDIIKNGEDSPYVDWYDIYSFPVDLQDGNYQSWHGYSSLPVLNYDNSEVRTYILEVVKYWMSLGVKGIRLDAPSEVPHDFWKELYQTVKEIDPEVLLIGEIWGDASPWINQKEFDSTMNYEYRDLLIKYFIKRLKRPSRFVKELGMDQTRYPEPVNHVLYNMVSTHDVERILTLAKGEVKRLKPMIIFQLTYLGAPAIYYGDEVGIEGRKDPDCRRPMIWNPEEQNHELLSLYKQMIKIRRSHPALQLGTYKTVYTDDKRKILVFEREYNGERIFTVINNSDEPQTLTIPFDEWGIKGAVEDLLNGGSYSDGDAELRLEANLGAVLLEL